MPRGALESATSTSPRRRRARELGLTWEVIDKLGDDAFDERLIGETSNGDG